MTNEHQILKPVEFFNFCNDTVTSVDPENHDVLVKFLHPHFPPFSFHWPSENGMCWVPDTHILRIYKKINPRVMFISKEVLYYCYNSIIFI